MTDKQLLLDNIDKLHTTPLDVERIRRNLALETDDVLAAGARYYRAGKNWYCEADGVRFTIHAQRYTIITAHRMT